MFRSILGCAVKQQRSVYTTASISCRSNILPLFITRVLHTPPCMASEKNVKTIKARWKAWHVGRGGEKKEREKKQALVRQPTVLPRRFYYGNRKVKINDHLRLVRQIYSGIFLRGNSAIIFLDNILAKIFSSRFLLTLYVSRHNHV